MAFETSRPRAPFDLSASYMKTFKCTRIGPTIGETGGYGINEGSHKVADTKCESKGKEQKVGRKDNTWGNYLRPPTSLQKFYSSIGLETLMAMQHSIDYCYSLRESLMCTLWCKDST